MPDSRITLLIAWFLFISVTFYYLGKHNADRWWQSREAPQYSGITVLKGGSLTIHTDGPENVILHPSSDSWNGASK